MQLHALLVDLIPQLRIIHTVFPSMHSQQGIHFVTCS
jgi:hypothetical protein